MRRPTSYARRAAGALLVLATTLTAGPHAGADEPPRYVAGGTVVVRDGSDTILDSGGMACDDGTGAGGGGVCLPFGADSPAVSLVDATSGEEIAFQVCVDNDGDGVCTTPDASGACADFVAFSHDGDGNFFNPVGPLPTDFTRDCPGGEWRGYVVFICEGLHVDGVGPHQHPATTGTGHVSNGGGEGSGDFCGGNEEQPTRKHYVVAPGNDAVQFVRDLTGVVDPALCPLVATASPGFPGIVDVDGEGDASVNGTQVYDCPPYGT